MRIESSVTSISWIPSEAVAGPEQIDPAALAEVSQGHRREAP